MSLKTTSSLLLAAATLGSLPAQASVYGKITQALIVSGNTTPAIVEHNLSVYETILDGVDAKLRNPGVTHAEKRSYARASIHDLQDRLDRQMGLLGRAFETVFSSRLSDALEKGRDAADRHDSATLLRMTAEARKEIRALRAELSL